PAVGDLTVFGGLAGGANNPVDVEQSALVPLRKQHPRPLHRIEAELQLSDGKDRIRIATFASRTQLPHPARAIGAVNGDIDRFGHGVRSRLDQLNDVENLQVAVEVAAIADAAVQKGNEVLI